MICEYNSFLTVSYLLKVGLRMKKLKTKLNRNDKEGRGWENEREEGWFLFPHPQWSEAMTLLSLRHGGPHTPSDRQGEYLQEVLLCLFVSTPINPPLVAPCHMLPTLNSWACWITGSSGSEQFPVCPATEEKITHTSYSASLSSFPPALSLPPLSYEESLVRPACSSDSPRQHEL